MTAPPYGCALSVVAGWRAWLPWTLYRSTCTSVDILFCACPPLDFLPMHGHEPLTYACKSRCAYLMVEVCGQLKMCLCCSLTRRDVIVPNHNRAVCARWEAHDGTSLRVRTICGCRMAGLAPMDFVSLDLHVCGHLVLRLPAP